MCECGKAPPYRALGRRFYNPIFTPSAVARRGERKRDAVDVIKERWAQRDRANCAQERVFASESMREGFRFIVEERERDEAFDGFYIIVFMGGFFSLSVYRHVREGTSVRFMMGEL